MVGLVLAWLVTAVVLFFSHALHRMLGEKVLVANMPDEVRARALKEVERLNQMPPMSPEGGIIRTDKGEAKPSGVRTKINDLRIEGPFETGWGFKDFEDQHNIIGLPNPLKD